MTNADPKSRFVWQEGDIEILEPGEDSQAKSFLTLAVLATETMGEEMARDFIADCQHSGSYKALPPIEQLIFRAGLERWAAKAFDSLPDKHEESFADCLINNTDKLDPVSFCIQLIEVKYAPDQPRDEGGRFSSDGSPDNAARGVASHLGQLLAKTGGYSYQPVSKKQPTTGYMVSVIAREKIFEAKPSVEDIRKYLTDNADVLDAEENYAGGWLDTETGKVYLDVSTRVEDRAEAERLSTELKQEAFYDVTTGESIYTRAREGTKSGGEEDGRDVLLEEHDGRGDSGGDRQPVRGLDQEELKFNPDQPRDEQGRWSGEGAEEHSLAVAQSFLGRAKEIEPALTKTISDVVTASGGSMAGLNFRVKGEGRAAQKIREDARDKHLTQEQAAAKISDLVRYTGIFREEDYRDGVEKTVAALKESGVTVAKVKNFWTNGDGSYRGINTQLVMPNGTRAELQFHTERSFSTKEATHPMLEKATRDPSTTPEERARLVAGMRAMSSSLPMPTGVEVLGHALEGHKALSYLTESMAPLIVRVEADQDG